MVSSQQSESLPRMELRFFIFTIQVRLWVQNPFQFMNACVTRCFTLRPHPSHIAHQISFHTNRLPAASLNTLRAIGIWYHSATACPVKSSSDLCTDHQISVRVTQYKAQAVKRKHTVIYSSTAVHKTLCTDVSVIEKGKKGAFNHHRGSSDRFKIG